MSIYAGPEIVNDGLVLHLDAANARSYPGSGTVWTDLSGLNSASTLMNGVTFDSEFGGKLILSASPKHIVTPFVLPTSNFTVIMPFKSLVGSGWCPLWACEVWNSQIGYIAYFTSQTSLYFSRGGGSGALLTTADCLQLALYSFTVTGAGLASIYVNGLLIASGTITLASSVTKPILLSTRYSNDGLSITDTRPSHLMGLTVYNRALTALEIKQNFNAVRGRYGL